MSSTALGVQPNREGQWFSHGLAGGVEPGKSALARLLSCLSSQRSPDPLPALRPWAEGW